MFPRPGTTVVVVTVVVAIVVAYVQLETQIYGTETGVIINVIMET